MARAVWNYVWNEVVTMNETNTSKTMPALNQCVQKIPKPYYTIYTNFVYTIHTIPIVRVCLLLISMFFIRIKIGVFHAWG